MVRMRMKTRGVRGFGACVRGEVLWRQDSLRVSLVLELHAHRLDFETRTCEDWLYD